MIPCQSLHQLGAGGHDSLPALHQLGIFVCQVHPPKPLPGEMIHGGVTHSRRTRA